MFRWNYKYSIEVNSSVKDAWQFFTNPSHWPKWEDRFEACFLIEKFKPGTQIKAEIKNKPVHVIILITEVNPYSEYRTLLQVPFFRQESVTSFQEYATGKVRITFQICALGFFVPFIRSRLLKKTEQTYTKLLEAFLEHSRCLQEKSGC